MEIQYPQRRLSYKGDLAQLINIYTRNDNTIIKSNFKDGYRINGSDIYCDDLLAILFSG